MPPPPARRDVAAATLVCAASMLLLGAWAFLAPASFSGFVDYPPYNRHLGGHASDVPALGLLTLIALYAIAARIRGRAP